MLPPSPPVQPADPALDRYVWVGAVTDRTFKIFVDVMPGEMQLLVSPDHDFGDVVYRSIDVESPTPGVDTAIYGRLRHFHVHSLRARTRYYVGMLRAADAPTNRGAVINVAQVTTFPTTGDSAEVVLALGSCQYRAKHSGALAEIAAWRRALAETRPHAAFLMLHMGDLHYANLRDNDPARFEAAIRNVVTDYGAHSLFSTTPVVYSWDDHDFGPNNSGGDSPARPAALESFHAMVPKSTPDTVYHAFTVANVRVIVTDLRSESNKNTECAMSPEQLRFFLDELREWRQYDAVVWVSSRPWIEPISPGSDRWGGFATQRREIANFIASQRIENLVVVSGDAHMLAADDGSHSCFAEPKFGTLGFPVLHAAPLSNVGSVKGGPYSEGVRTSRFTRTQQYALLTIRPSGQGSSKQVDIAFNGYRVRNRFISDPLTLLKKQPVLSFSTSRPFLKDNALLGGDKPTLCSQTLRWLTRPARKL